MQIAGKNIVLTGATSGIGSALLRELLKRDCTITAASRRAESLDIEHPKLLKKRCDVSKREDIDELFSFAVQQMGTVDIFIANAGFAFYESLQNPDWAHIQSIIDTDLISVIYAAQKLKALKGSQPFSLMITASAMSWLSIPGYALYSAAKAGLRGFADAYRHELSPGQHLQMVYPIAVNTQFFHEAGSRKPWPSQSPEHVARRMVKGLQNGKNHIYPSRLFLLARMIFPFLLRGYVLLEHRKFLAQFREGP